MKKIIILIALLIVTGCTSTSEIGTWVKPNTNNKYTFNEDGTCMKVTDTTTVKCTYTKEDTVINIYVNGSLYESGQLSPKSIIIGSELYEKEK